MYAKKLKEYKSRQSDILLQLEEHSEGDRAFCPTANHVLNLANRALEIFEGPKGKEKRALLNFLLQNPVLEGKNLIFELNSHLIAPLLALKLEIGSLLAGQLSNL